MFHRSISIKHVNMVHNTNNISIVVHHLITTTPHNRRNGVLPSQTDENPHDPERWS